MNMKLLTLVLVLTAQDDDRMRAWVDQLGALYESERLEARKQLAAAGASAEKHLVRGLDHADHKVRKGCLELLAPLNAESGVNRACEIFRSKSEDRSVQAAAFDYLRQHGARAEDLFIDALDHAEETYRLGAIEVLTGIRSARALPKAAELFDRETVKSIKDRIFALYKVTGDPARPYLIKLLGNSDAAIRQESLASLVAMNTPAEELVDPVNKLLKLEVTEGILTLAFDVYARAGEKATPQLLEGLRSPTQAVRRKALEAVRNQKTEGALEGVAELYHRETADDIRAIALAYLVDQGLRSEPALIKALESPLPKVRMEAIPALGRIKSEKVFDRVAALYKNEKDVEVRKACFAYFETVGLRAEEELIVAMKDDDPSIRKRAIRALGTAGSVKAIAPLADHLKEEKSPTRVDAIEALAAIGDKAVEFLREGVKAQRVREADADEVVALVNQVAVERVLDTMITEDASGQLTTGTWPGQFEPLAKLGKDRVLPVLWKMASEADYAVRFRDATKTASRYPVYLQCLAILALGELGDSGSIPRLQGLSYPVGEDRHREQLVALHRLGEKKPLEEFVAAELMEGRKLLDGEERDTGYRKLFNAALLQSRAGLKVEALKTYTELVQAVEKGKQVEEFQDTAAAYYNIACLHAGAGKKAEALAALTRSVDLGFRDVEWFEKDRDLDPLRAEHGFRNLIDSLKKK